MPKGTYLIAQLELTGANKTLHLLDGAKLIAARERGLYGARQEDWYALVLRDCTGCAILGQGSATIDGRGRNWVTGWAPGLEVLPILLPALLHIDHLWTFPLTLTATVPTPFTLTADLPCVK